MTSAKKADFAMKWSLCWVIAAFAYTSLVFAHEDADDPDHKHEDDHKKNDDGKRRFGFYISV